MILLDEHVPPGQYQRLHGWHVSVRQIGHDLDRKGMKDDEIIPFLRSLRRPTFVTLDAGFYDRGLCHARYCLIHTSVRQLETAAFVRRLLRHPEFDTQAKRMGKVLRLSHAGISVWLLHAQQESRVEWDE